MILWFRMKVSLHRDFGERLASTEVRLFIAELCIIMYLCAIRGGWVSAWREITLNLCAIYTTGHQVASVPTTSAITFMQLTFGVDGHCCHFFGFRDFCFIQQFMTFQGKCFQNIFDFLMHRKCKHFHTVYPSWIMQYYAMVFLFYSPFCKSCKKGYNAGSVCFWNSLKSTCWGLSKYSAAINLSSSKIINCEFVKVVK